MDNIWETWYEQSLWNLDFCELLLQREDVWCIFEEIWRLRLKKNHWGNHGKNQGLNFSGVFSARAEHPSMIPFMMWGKTQSPHLSLMPSESTISLGTWPGWGRWSGKPSLSPLSDEEQLEPRSSIDFHPDINGVSCASSRFKAEPSTARTHSTWSDFPMGSWFHRGTWLQLLGTYAVAGFDRVDARFFSPVDAQEMA